MCSRMWCGIEKVRFPRRVGVTIVSPLRSRLYKKLLLDIGRLPSVIKQQFSESPS
jgi:hypothetical protein